MIPATQIRRGMVLKIDGNMYVVLDYELASYEIALRHWALHCENAARVVREVSRTRLDYATEAFAELGFTGEDLEARALLFVVYTTWESPMFGKIAKKRRRALIGKRVELLTRRD